MVNFALYINIGFKVIYFLKSTCSSAVAKSLLKMALEQLMSHSGSPSPALPPQHLWLLSFTWFHKVLNPLLSACLVCCDGTGLIIFSFPGTGTKYWLSTSHSAQKLPEESSWSFTKCWFPLGVFAGGWFWIDFDPFGAQLIACIPAGIFKAPCVHWSDCWQMSGFVLLCFVFNLGEPGNDCTSGNLIKAGMIQACLLKCNQTACLSCFSLIFHR